MASSSRVGGLPDTKVLDSVSSNEDVSEQQMPAALRAKIERNRQRALLLKHAKLIPHPCTKINTSESVEKSVIRVQGTRFIDTGGGFLLEESEQDNAGATPELTEVPPPIIEPERPTCDECQETFPDSFLFQNFDYPVCDQCRDNDDKHALITKTEAKSEYLLKDCDFDRREPTLKFITRKNPHNQQWGQMKLYLQVQVEKRALEVWGSEEKLEVERELRNEKKEKSQFKKYQKNLKQLKMNVRSSLFDKTSAVHTHEFGTEVYHSDDDMYSHTCTTCHFVESYEKM